MENYKIACISDTHRKHSMIDTQLFNGVDILIHSGDGSNSKSPSINEAELRECLSWISGLDIKHKIYVPGNHDTSFYAGLVKEEEYKDIIFLVNEYTTIDGDLTIWGSPYTPSFGHGWAYNCNRGKIEKYWNTMPDNTDIAVTHGPPYSILDKTNGYQALESGGCKNLLKKILQVSPKYHIFGHFHDEKGIINNGCMRLPNKNDITFVNASCVDIRHAFVNNPIILEI